MSYFQIFTYISVDIAFIVPKIWKFYSKFSGFCYFPQPFCHKKF